MLVGITQIGGNHQRIVLNFMSGAFCEGDRGFLNCKHPSTAVQVPTTALCLDLGFL
jgi:hypothetical protein